MKTQKKIVKTTRTLLKYFDIYGQNVNLYINKSPKLRSACSGLISLAIIVMISYTLIGVILSWMNREKMRVITSELSLSISQILDKNENYKYELSYNNYNIYFSVRAFLPNGTTLINQQLRKYFTYNFYLIDEKLQKVPINYEYCKTDNYDIFLGKDKETIKRDQNKTNQNRLCLQNSVILGLFADPKLQVVHQPELHFSIKPCVNSTENRNMCSTQNEIHNIIKYTNIQASIPITFYDFQNAKNPQKNYYDYKFIDLDEALSKSYKNYLIPTLLYTDYGLINDEYRLEGTTFNPDIFYDSKIRQNDDYLFDFSFMVSPNLQMYYQKNLKVNELIGSLGGIINAIFLLGKFFCSFYNSVYIKFKMIKSTFRFPDYQNPTTVTRMVSNLKYLKFTLNDYFFHSKKLKNFYDKGSKSLNEYLDIIKIVKRMQDIDKLKMILLNENQLKLFETIPKPDILTDNQKKSSKKIFQKASKKYFQANNENMRSPDQLKIFNKDSKLINKNISRFFDPKHKSRFHSE